MKKIEIINVDNILQQVNLSALSVNARKEIITLSLELSKITKEFNEEKQTIQDKLFKDLNLEEYVKDNQNPKFDKERGTEKEFNTIVTEMLQENVNISKSLSQDTIMELPSAIKDCNMQLIHYLISLFINS